MVPKALPLVTKAHQSAPIITPLSLTCFIGSNQQTVPSIKEQDNAHGKHKEKQCKGCNTSKRADYFQKDSTMCNVCSKRKAKTVINGPTSNFLTVGALNQLPQRQ